VRNGRGPRSRAFIVDIDGTIIDSMPYHALSWEIFLDRHGKQAVGQDLFRRTAGHTGSEVMRELFGPLTDDEAHALTCEKDELGAPQHVLARAQDFTTLDPGDLAARLYGAPESFARHEQA